MNLCAEVLHILPILDPHVALDIVAASFEEVSHLELSLGRVDLSFNLSIGVIDDGQEHVLAKANGIRLVLEKFHGLLKELCSRSCESFVTRWQFLEIKVDHKNGHFDIRPTFLQLFRTKELGKQ